MNRYPVNRKVDWDTRRARLLNKKQKKDTKAMEHTLYLRESYQVTKYENKCQMQEVPSQESTD